MSDLRNAIQKRAAEVVAMPMNPPADLKFVMFQPANWLAGNPAMVAMVGDEVIGMLSYMATSMYRRETDLLYVKPAWRRRGIGTLLWEELKKEKPSMGQSSYRSDAGEAWKNSADPEAASRYKTYQTDWAEEDGATALARVQEQMDGAQKAALKVES